MGDGDGDMVADRVGDVVDVLTRVDEQRSSVAFHTKFTAQAGAPSSFVHAGPTTTPLGHQLVRAPPHPAGVITEDVDRDAYVNTDDDLQIAIEAPWQVSVAASHWRPVSHRVAERGPE